MIDHEKINKTYIQMLEKAKTTIKELEKCIKERDIIIDAFISAEKNTLSYDTLAVISDRVQLYCLKQGVNLLEVKNYD